MVKVRCEDGGGTGSWCSLCGVTAESVMRREWVRFRLSWLGALDAVVVVGDMACVMS